MNSVWRIALIVILVLVNAFIYIVFGLLLMNYDDFYDESKGEYWSLESMNQTERLTVYGLQFWNIVNVIAIGYIVYRIIKHYRKKNVLQHGL
jgi:hypothetical protein